jgi:hypothetical protein
VDERLYRLSTICCKAVWTEKGCSFYRACSAVRITFSLINQNTEKEIALSSIVSTGSYSDCLLLVQGEIFADTGNPQHRLTDIGQYSGFRVNKPPFSGITADRLSLIRLRVNPLFIERASSRYGQ